MTRSRGCLPGVYRTDTGSVPSPAASIARAAAAPGGRRLRPPDRGRLRSRGCRYRYRTIPCRVRPQRSPWTSPWTSPWPSAGEWPPAPGSTTAPARRWGRCAARLGHGRRLAAALLVAGVVLTPVVTAALVTPLVVVAGVLLAPLAARRPFGVRRASLAGAIARDVCAGAGSSYRSSRSSRRSGLTVRSGSIGATGARGRPWRRRWAGRHPRDGRRGGVSRRSRASPSRPLPGPVVVSGAGIVRGRRRHRRCGRPGRPGRPDAPRAPGRRAPASPGRSGGPAGGPERSDGPVAGCGTATEGPRRPAPESSSRSPPRSPARSSSPPWP